MLLLVVSSQIVNAQYMNNKLDVRLSAITATPMGTKSIDGLPSLFANYQGTIGLMISSRYQVFGDIGIGLDYISTTFDKNRVERFPSIADPSSTFNTFLASLSYIRGRRLEYGAKISAGITSHSLEINHLIIPTEFPVFPDQRFFNETEFAMQGGLLVGYHPSSELKFVLELMYQQTGAGNLLYVDESFRSFILSVGLTKKLLKNKFFQYD